MTQLSYGPNTFNNNIPSPQVINPATAAPENWSGAYGSGFVQAARVYTVGASATTTAIPLLSSTGLSLNLTTQRQAQFEGAIISVNISGTIYESVCTSISAAGIAQLDAALPSAPTTGQFVFVYASSHVSLTGTIPPLDSVTPKLIATIPYSQFTTASSNIYPYYSGVLTRSARERTFILYNTMNQALTASSLAFYDSILGIGGQPGIARTAVFTPPGIDSVTYTTSEMASNQGEGLVASHMDSLQAILGIGATLPTSGNLLIYVSELL